jgi:hypothetical protein
MWVPSKRVSYSPFLRQPSGCLLSMVKFFMLILYLNKHDHLWIIIAPSHIVMCAVNSLSYHGTWKPPQCVNLLVRNSLVDCSQLGECCVQLRYSHMKLIPDPGLFIHIVFFSKFCWYFQGRFNREVSWKITIITSWAKRWQWVSLISGKTFIMFGLLEFKCGHGY